MDCYNSRVIENPIVHYLPPPSPSPSLEDGDYDAEVGLGVADAPEAPVDQFGTMRDAMAGEISRLSDAMVSLQDEIEQLRRENLQLKTHQFVANTNTKQ